MIQVRARYNNNKELETLKETLSKLGLIAGIPKVKDYYKTVVFRPVQPITNNDRNTATLTKNQEKYQTIE